MRQGCGTVDVSDAFFYESADRGATWYWRRTVLSKLLHKTRGIRLATQFNSKLWSLLIWLCVFLASIGLSGVSLWGSLCDIQLGLTLLIRYQDRHQWGWYCRSQGTLSNRIVNRWLKKIKVTRKPYILCLYRPCENLSITVVFSRSTNHDTIHHQFTPIFVTKFIRGFF